LNKYVLYIYMCLYIDILYGRSVAVSSHSQEEVVQKLDAPKIAAPTKAVRVPLVAVDVVNSGFF
jgi:hypothetical protein